MLMFSSIMLHVCLYALASYYAQNYASIICQGLFKGMDVLYRDASQATCVLGPPPARGRDLELDGGVNVSL